MLNGERLKAIPSRPRTTQECCTTSIQHCTRESNQSNQVKNKSERHPDRKGKKVISICK